MRYEILNDNNEVINTIVADEAFVEAHFPGRYRLIPIENDISYIQEKAQEVRLDRDKKLSESDWTQLSDAPVNQQAWAVYRQALRDIPTQEGFPLNVNWPVKPE